MAHELPALPYDYRALEPHISGHTMEIHHIRLHRGYVDNLNKLLAGREDLARMDLEHLLANVEIIPQDIRQGVIDNGGGHLNHGLFWQVMGPGGGGRPTGWLRQNINATFDSFSAFRQQFSAAAAALFGSGWTWLVVEPPEKLRIISTPNQDSPIMLGCRPTLGVDVWEHAYYLHYQHRRSEYIQAWWSVVNWQKVAELYAQAMKLLAHAPAG